jgi:release factor glutamine methyltransferase
MKTVLEVIQATSEYFAKRGVESPRLSIEHLLAHVLGKRRMDLYLEFDRPLSDAELEPLRDLVRRRAAGEPLQHLLGTVDFLGRVFRSDKRALVPRPETEQLCEILLERWKGQTFTGRIVDVGTGTGIIALTLAAEWPQAQVEAVDLSADALALAAENAAKLELIDRVRFVQGDLLADVEGPFALIVANLPYIAAGEIAELSREVQFDPRSALDGGEIGTELIFRLIEQATGKLQGAIALEIGHQQSAAVCAELARHKYQDIKPATDYQGRNRFVFAKYG